MSLSTHILDIAAGKPAVGVPLALSVLQKDDWLQVGNGTTDADGRCRTLLGEHQFRAATYKIRFETGEYFSTQDIVGLYPFVEIVFSVADPAQHYHIPLLLTANGYTTYRGS